MNKKIKPIIIFGTGEAARLAYRYFCIDTNFKVCGFAVDKKFRTVDHFFDLPVIEFESVEITFPPDHYSFFVPLGYMRMNAVREEKFLAVKSKGYRCVSYIHSSIAKIDEWDVGENCLILENQSINLDAKIGNNVVIWSHCHVGDRSVIEDHCWLSSGTVIGGDAIIKKNSFLGLHSCILNNVVVGERCFVGANSLINTNTQANSSYVVAGTPQSALSSEKLMAIFC